MYRTIYRTMHWYNWYHNSPPVLYFRLMSQSALSLTSYEETLRDQSNLNFPAYANTQLLRLKKNTLTTQTFKQLQPLKPPHHQLHTTSSINNPLLHAAQSPRQRRPQYRASSHSTHPLPLSRLHKLAPQSRKPEALFRNPLIPKATKETYHN